MSDEFLKTAEGQKLAAYIRKQARRDLINSLVNQMKLAQEIDELVAGEEEMEVDPEEIAAAIMAAEGPTEEELVEAVLEQAGETPMLVPEDLGEAIVEARDEVVGDEEEEEDEEEDLEEKVSQLIRKLL